MWFRPLTSCPLTPVSRIIDPYYEWLGIPPKHQPANHYRLLGLDLFEQNRSVIDAAANRQMSFVKQYELGEDSAALSQALLNELSSVRLCLLNPERKAAYDDQLRAELQGSSADATTEQPGSANPEHTPAGSQPAAGLPRPPSKPKRSRQPLKMCAIRDRT